MLTRYWIQFARFNEPSPLNLGCGVTAESQEDALFLIRTKVLRGTPVAVGRIIASVDIATLDQAHVIPNMGNPLIRGVWFPLGY